MEEQASSSSSSNSSSASTPVSWTTPDPEKEKKQSNPESSKKSHIKFSVESILYNSHEKRTNEESDEDIDVVESEDEVNPKINQWTPQQSIRQLEMYGHSHRINIAPTLGLPSLAPPYISPQNSYFNIHHQRLPQYSGKNV